jgi:ABC-2 type transport system ATP-binding protein
LRKRAVLRQKLFKKRKSGLIEIRNVTKKFGELAAVSNVNLTIEKGELFGFLGPNGAGKTTTIKMLVGLISPSSGEIFENGVNILKEPSRTKRWVGYIPDQPFVYEKLTAREFLKFVSDLYEVEPRVSAKRIEEFLDFFDLRDWGDEVLEGFSHGMRQKVVFSAALIHDPLILVIDEPMIGLDPKSAKQVKIYLKELSAKGKTIFMSTHSLTLAEDACSTIAIINKGKLIARGSFDEIRRATESPGSNLEEVFLKITEEEIEERS